CGSVHCPTRPSSPERRAVIRIWPLRIISAEARVDVGLIPARRSNWSHSHGAVSFGCARYGVRLWRTVNKTARHELSASHTEVILIDFLCLQSALLCCNT